MTISAVSDPWEDVSSGEGDVMSSGVSKSEVTFSGPSSNDPIGCGIFVGASNISIVVNDVADVVPFNSNFFFYKIKIVYFY